MGNSIAVELYTDPRLVRHLEAALVEQQRLSKEIVLHNLYVLLVRNFRAVYG